MSVLMYSPGIKTYISTQNNGILDISEDLVNGTLIRNSDAPSTFSFTLQNARRKYDGIFAPNDRIIVMMKRLSWLRVFTGYLNAVPLVTAWPQAVQFTATCSLKRLQYWFWDPGMPSSQNLVNAALAKAKNPDDGGIASAIYAILENVVGWPAANTHIAGIPQNWFKWVYKIAKEVAAETAAADQLAQQFYGILAGAGSVGGSTGGSVGSGALKPGKYGGYNLDASQAANAVVIYNTGVTMGMSDRDIEVALMTAMAESSLQNLDHGDQDSVGLFQQRPSQGWGSAQQLQNPQYAAQQFYKALSGISKRNSMSLQMEAQTVQRSAYANGSNYAPYQNMAIQIDTTLRSASSGGKATGGFAGKATGTALLNTAQNLVKQHPNIPYNEGGDSPPNSSVPSVLDCSSFTQWCVFHTLGNLNGMPRVAADQQSWCKSKGQLVSAQQGMKTQGALMFNGNPAGHVEISVGDGQHTIGAHQSGTYAGQVASSASYWTGGAGLAPGFDYSGSGGGAGTGSGSGQGVQLSTVDQQPWYNPNDPYDKLFGSSPWIPQWNVDTTESMALTGLRALLNDQPLLPYLKNMISSTMRSFSSAPNGDFISWFPDYYGLWGTAAIMQIEPIELQDFTVYWDDTYLITHQFTVAPLAQQNAIDLSTGTVAAIGPLATVITSGIASIDIPGIMYALFGLEPTKAQAAKFIDWVYKRFGARPDFQTPPGVVGPQGEFFSALFLFMRSWAYQYNANIPLTFMPELWPGMLAQIPSYGFQAYVTTVTHNFQFGPGGGFTTSVNIAAPSRLPGTDGDSSGHLIGMPIAGGLMGNPSLPFKPGG